MKSVLGRLIKRASNKLPTVFFPSCQKLEFGEGNHIHASPGCFRKCVVKFFGNNNKVVVLHGASLSNLEIVFLGSNNILTIESNVTYGKGLIWFASDSGNIKIGEKSVIAEASFTITEPNLSIAVGKDCLFSWGIDVRCGDGHPIIDQDTGKKLNSARSIHIGDHVWLAANVNVQKSTAIGDNSVIGSRATVTRDIPANCVAVGTPAKVVRQNITWMHENVHDLPT